MVGLGGTRDPGFLTSSWIILRPDYAPGSLLPYPVASRALGARPRGESRCPVFTVLFFLFPDPRAAELPALVWNGVESFEIPITRRDYEVKNVVTLWWETDGRLNDVSNALQFSGFCKVITTHFCLIKNISPIKQNEKWTRGWKFWV